jgi:hypothetical protein
MDEENVLLVVPYPSPSPYLPNCTSLSTSLLKIPFHLLGKGNNMKEAKAIKALIPLLKLYPWSVPAIIVLGFLSSLSERLGISLFIPLLQSLEQTNSQAVSRDFFVGFINRLFIHVSLSNRFLIIALCGVAERVFEKV